VSNIDSLSASSISIPSYGAASLIAEEVENHFRIQHESIVQSGGEDLAPIPTSSIISDIVNATFWSSLQREEGHSPKISVAYVPPELSEEPLIFENRKPLVPSVLTRLAPAVERPGIHLGVWEENGVLYIWGTTTLIPALCFVLEVVQPGMMVVKHRRIGGGGKFVNVAVLNGSEIKIIDEKMVLKPDCPKLVNSMLGFTTHAILNEDPNMMVQLAVSMRSHQRGGTLLFVPSNSNKWRDSIVKPISNAINPPFSELMHLSHQKYSEFGQATWQDKVQAAINHIAGFTAVDGATIMTDQFEVLAFGAKIGQDPNGTSVEEILVTEPVLGIEPKVVHPVYNGGTRHLSAAQFVFDQRDATALVASQDGKFTVFTWSKYEQIVQAHRVDALLL
jgi:DNA integrity scanning protein DisA with diadenylate cyclase activity